MRPRRVPLLLLLGGLVLPVACRSRAATEREDDGRWCRLEVVGRPGRYEAHVAASSTVPGDATVESGLRWRAAGRDLWHPVGERARTGPDGGAGRVVPLPGLVGQGDLVRLEVVWFDGAGEVTWRRAVEALAP